MFSNTPVLLVRTEADVQEQSVTESKGSSESSRSLQSLSSPESLASYSSLALSNRSDSTVSDFRDFHLELDPLSPELISMSRSESITRRMSSFRLDSKKQVKPYKDLKFLDRNNPLGRGTAGIVYAATVGDDETVYAVKELRNINPDSEGQVKAFLTEFQQISQVKSNYTLKAKWICAVPPDPCCIILELMDGSLYDILIKTEFSWSQRLQLASDIIEGLCDLFNQNKIQRDLKSSNILLTKPDQMGLRKAKLSDLDLITLSNETHSVFTESLAGTINWMAPEQLEKLEVDNKNTKHKEIIFEYNEKTVVYTFGWLLWSLLSRKTPFEFQETKKEKVALTTFIIKEVVKGSRAQIPDLTNPPDYTKLIVDCWAQNQASRPTLNEARDRISKILKT